MANQFLKDFTKLLKKAGEKAETLVKASSLQLLQSVDAKSPVGDPSTWSVPAPAGYTGGQFRANWNWSLNEADKTTTTDKDPNGGLSLSKAAQKVGSYKLGDKIIISNSLPYAYRLEYGWSKQAPQGMVRLSVMEFESHIKEQAALL